MKKSKPLVAVFDAEFDGFNPTKIHCLSANFYKDGKWTLRTTTDYDEMRKLFSKCEMIIGHNIILFDIPCLERLLDIKIEGRIIDTLGLSWYLYPLRSTHNLEDWGEDFGIKKPEVDDWEGLSVEEYIHRCEEDVKINTKLYLKQLKYLKTIYKNIGDYNKAMNYLSFKLSCVALQEKSKWKVDLNKLRDNLDRFTNYVEECKTTLESVMPDNPKTRTKKKPKQKYKKNGEYTSYYLDWIEKLESAGLDHENYEGDSIKYIHHYEPPNAQSVPQIKDWLFSIGWEPKTFNYINDEDEESGYRKVPQIKDGDELCDSIIELQGEYPEIKALSDYHTAKHRKDMLTNMLDNQTDGWIMAQIAGLTNTLRFRHKTLVNLPGVSGTGDWADGEHIRGCLVAPEGYELCGSDMSSLEDRTKQHYLYYYDPEYVKEMQSDDFDPHLDIGIRGGMITEEEAEWYKNEKKRKKDKGYVQSEKDKERFQSLDAKRHGAKTTNYSCTYGAGARKISLASGRPLEEAKKLHESYWKRNWAIKQIQEDSTVQKIGTQMWVWNPVSKMWYSLRYKKDIFSTLNQGTGAYCFDLWVANVLENRPQLTGQFHDEIILTIKEGNREACNKLLKDSIAKTNKQLKLNVDLDVDVQFGSSYAEIH